MVRQPCEWSLKIWKYQKMKPQYFYRFDFNEILWNVANVTLVTEVVFPLPKSKSGIGGSPKPEKPSTSVPLVVPKLLRRAFICSRILLIAPMKRTNYFFWDDSCDYRWNIMGVSKYFSWCSDRIKNFNLRKNDLETMLAISRNFMQSFLHVWIHNSCMLRKTEKNFMLDHSEMTR